MGGDEADAAGVRDASGSADGVGVTGADVVVAVGGGVIVGDA